MAVVNGGYSQTFDSTFPPGLDRALPPEGTTALQATASGIVNLLERAHSLLDALESTPTSGGTTNASLPGLTCSLMTAESEMGRLVARLENLGDRIGQL